MRNLRILAAAFLIISITTQAEELKWYSFNEGVELAKSQDKMILIDFYTDWCTWCKKMEAEIYSNPEIIDLLNKYFVAIRLNPEKDGMVKYNGKDIQASALVQSMGLTGYPSTGFLDSKGQLINLITGYKTLSEFRKLLDFFISGKYQTVDYNNFTFIIHFENELSKAPDNTDLQFILGYVYHKIMNDYNLASEFYNKALKDNSLQALIYVSLSELEAKNGNKEKALEYYKIALDNGFNNFDEVNQKISEIAKKYSPKQ